MILRPHLGALGIILDQVGRLADSGGPSIDPPYRAGAAADVRHVKKAGLRPAPG